MSSAPPRRCRTSPACGAPCWATRPGWMARGRDARSMDEDDVRSRANPRGTRPRSKQRPAHENAADGMVIAVDRGRYLVLVGDIAVTAMKARELGRKSV